MIELIFFLRNKFDKVLAQKYGGGLVLDSLLYLTLDR